MVDSTTINDEDYDGFNLWFKSDKLLYAYVLFPGQKIFMSGLNLWKTLKPITFSGLKVFQLDVKTEVSENIPNGECRYVDGNLFSVLAAHKSYEIWLEF